jgi:uncharacterized heparinase superfamily protein
LALGESPCLISGIYVDDTTFRFLNVSVNLRSRQNKFEWAPRCVQRVWRYNLHYFEYLRESLRPAKNKDRLIQSWIDENPQGSQPGWEPYTASLRIVNWIFYLTQRPPEDIPTAWLDSLYLQASWLERNDERHILANHYFENLKALYFAGCFFDHARAKRWLLRAQKEIKVQLREQTLRDGGHYERSHQYHCRMLENYLDIINLGQAQPELSSREFIAEVRATAERGLAYLKATLFPDGTIPLFNDSTLNVSVLPTELFAYAERLRVDVNQDSPEESDLIEYADSGLYGCRAGNDMILIDCGDIGPAYQPGHTHCDFLSYELMLARRRIVVDTGVCEYEPGALRNYVRSTSAHNTVVVDGGEQSEIWGEFRVARRARKLFAKITKEHTTVEFTGAFRGFYDVGGQIEHQRTVTIALRPDGKTFEKLSVTDRLHGRGHHIAESFVHFHPDITLEPARSGEINLLESGSLVAVIRSTEQQESRIESTVYCPEFGKKIPNQVLVLRTQGLMPLTLRYEIEIFLR